MTFFASLARIAPITALVACTGSSPAQFDHASQPQIDRAIVAGVDEDAVVGVELALFSVAFGDMAGACPVVAKSGSDNYTLTGGCTSSGGTRVDGSVQLTGFDPQVTTAGAPTAPFHATLTFDQLKLTGSVATADVQIDGTITLDGTGTQTTMTSSLDTELLGIAARTDMTATCTSTSCSLGDGSKISVDGLGDATVTGTYNQDLSAVAVTLAGADELSVNGNVGSGCAPYAISNGTGGQFCASALGE